MTKLIIVLLIGLTLEAIGVVFLSKGLKQIGKLEIISLSEIARIVKQGVANANILFGVFLEALFFAALLYLISQADLSFVWPLTALGFVLTTLCAKIFLHEEVSLTRWAGVVLIMTGAALITWSEKKKAPLPATVAATHNFPVPK